MNNHLSHILKENADNYGFDNGQKPLPPVHLWHPEHCGDIGMEIRKDGSWWHDGVRISREKLVFLFSRILRKDDDGNTYLVTPHEKVIVRLEDAHFIIIRADKVDEKIIFTTNLGEMFELNKEHPLWVEFNPETNEPRPYVMVRSGLFALINRSVFYELVDWAESEGDKLFITSNGQKFELGNF